MSLSEIRAIEHNREQWDNHFEVKRMRRRLKMVGRSFCNDVMDALLNKAVRKHDRKAEVLVGY